MTLVAAFRSLDRIVTLSDSLISNRDHPRPNAIPGRLKSIVLNRWLTVSYAGLSSQALDCIRKIRASPQLTTEKALQMLYEFSARESGAVDFLLCSHELPGVPRLAKVHNGAISEGLDVYWIGDGDAARLFARHDLSSIPDEAGGEYYTLEERQFARRFHEFLDSRSSAAVGGLAVEALASAHGHCYTDRMEVYVETVTVPDPLVPELRNAMNKAGMNGYYSCSVSNPVDRGEAIVGMYFEQAEIGYIHAPLLHDDAVKVNAENGQQFQALVRAMFVPNSE